MVTDMVKDERIKLRAKLLHDLYEFHFDNRGAECQIKSKVDLSAEHYLAYMYLKESGYFEVRVNRKDSIITSIGAKITIKGINRVEETVTKSM